MDDFDKSILRILQQDNLTPQRDIGDQIGLSAAAVQRRIKKMRQDGIIKADVAIIDRYKLNNPVTIMVEVTLNNENSDLVNQAKETFISTPEVQQCYYVTGESDFVLIIVADSMHDYEKLTRQIFFSNENIKNFRTVVAMDVLKAGLEIKIS